MSEGFIQSIASTVFLDDFRKEKELRELLTGFFNKNFNLVIIDCDIDESEASDWILSKMEKTQFSLLTITNLEGNDPPIPRKAIKGA